MNIVKIERRTFFVLFLVTQSSFAELINFSSSAPYNSGISLTTEDLSIPNEGIVLTTVSPPWTHCLNGHGYRSLQECKTACHFRQTGVRTASAQEMTVTHKLIVLDPDEYIVDNNYLISSEFTTKDFVIRGGMAETCYPLQEKFIYCHKRCVSLDEINMTDSNRMLIGSSEMPYDFDDFYLVNTTDGNCVGAAVCETGTTFIIFPTACLVFSTACVWMVVMMTLIFPNRDCNRVLLYHLITFATGFIITAVKSVTTLYHSYYVPTDDCMVLTAVQEFFYLFSFFAINVNMRNIYLLMREDLSQSILPGNNYSRQKQQLKIVFRFSLLMVSLIFGLFTFVCEVLPMPGKFFPEYSKHCEHYRQKHRRWFMSYYCWMVYTLFSNIVLFFVITKRFYTWNKNVNNNTDSNMPIQKKKVLSRLCLHLILLLCMIIWYWSWITFLVPWDTTTSMLSGIIEMMKAIGGIYLFVLYVRSISLVK